MPTPQLDDRKTIAFLAEAHGWVVSEVRVNQGSSKAMFEVHYVNQDAGIIACYNWLDKLVSAHLHLDDGSLQDHALKMVTLQKWMAEYGQPIEDLSFGGGRATLKRGGELVASALRHPNGEWVIRLEHGSGIISINGMPENAQRRVLLAAMKAL